MRLFTKRASSQDIEAAEQAFMRVKSQVEGVRRTSLFDGELGVYQRWYFEFRLKEEVARASRYGDSLGLMVISISRRSDDEAAWSHLVSRAAYAISHAARATDLVAVLDTGVFGVCLVECEQDGAELAGQRLEAALRDIPHAIGGALFPQDNLGPEELLTLTLHRVRHPLEHAATYAPEIKPPAWA